MLAGQISGVPDSVIIFVVAAGVGLAVVAAFAGFISVSAFLYLIVCYLLAFILSVLPVLNSLQFLGSRAV